jgi:hypothetical protein
MAGDISKNYLTPAEIKAGFRLVNNGREIDLYYDKGGSRVLQFWSPSLPNLEGPIRAWFDQYHQIRTRMIQVLWANTEDERKAINDYKNSAIGARNARCEGLAKTYDALSREEEGHYNRLTKLSNKIQKGEL